MTHFLRGRLQRNTREGDIFYCDGFGYVEGLYYAFFRRYAYFSDVKFAAATFAATAAVVGVVFFSFAAVFVVIAAAFDAVVFATFAA